MRFYDVTVAATIIAAATLMPAAKLSVEPQCRTNESGHAGGVTVGGFCGKGHGNQTGSPTQTKTIVCGQRISKTNGLWDNRCGPLVVCQTKKGKPEDAMATLVREHGRWVLSAVWCPNNTKPVPPRQAIREQVLRLLPAVPIGSAWTHRALVNAQTILWADTDPDRDLRAVTVVGRQVRLRIAFARATWNFGDGATDTTTEPGKRYDTSQPCNTAQCPGYYGHTYRDTGTVTITLRVAWRAQYSLDGGAWTDVTRTPLTGATATHRLRVEQARGVIVH